MSLSVNAIKVYWDPASLWWTVDHPSPGVRHLQTLDDAAVSQNPERRASAPSQRVTDHGRPVGQGSEGFSGQGRDSSRCPCESTVVLLSGFKVGDASGSGVTAWPCKDQLLDLVRAKTHLPGYQ